MFTRALLLFTFLATSLFFLSQEYTQNIKGQILDESSQEPIPFASVVILESDPLIGTTTDIDGYFKISNVPLGRYDIKVSYIGFEPAIMPEVSVTAAKEIELVISLRELTETLDEVLIKPRILKDAPLNKMASVSARMLSVEEANRYAGGFDDPARLASSFPGVASNVGNNAITIRGNAPKFLQWKMEEVEIPNPNHFANLGVSGGGGLTALSSNLLANSDFYTGAFPAEYNNALSGVFDIKMRSGNSSKHEHSVELGAIGLDVASEGPLSKEGYSSYLINYRYSTLGLIAPLLPENSKGTNYQDLAFKFKFPTEKHGTFSLWGLGLLDKSGKSAEKNVDKQKYYNDLNSQKVQQYMGVSGINHKFFLKNSSYINSIVALSMNGIDLNTEQLSDNSVLKPENKIKNISPNLTIKSYLNRKISKRHTNRTGILFRGMGYDLLFKNNNGISSNLETQVDEKGFSSLVSAFSNSSFNFEKLTLNAGVNTQLFTLNNNYTIEPRLGLSYQLNKTNKLSLGYGLHSRLEALNIYFANTINSTNSKANKDLDFTKSHHWIMAYDWNISDKLHFKAESYFQYLFNIPSIESTSSSIINLQNDWFVNDTYINTGKGKNYGIEITLEQYINKGFYYLISASAFDSKYKGDTDNWYNTRYNRGFLLNALVGKEFNIGKEKQNLLSFNVKFSLQGGDRYSRIDNENSILSQDVVYNENTPFTEQASNSFISNVSINYEWNKKKTTQKLSFKVINANNFKEFQGHRYNLKSQKIEEQRDALLIPNLSYKISF